MQKMPAELRFVPPMECKEVRRVEDIPTGEAWQYEIKFDGYRCIAIKQSNQVELFSRRGLEFSQFANLNTELARLGPKRFILDGEIVALDEDGRPDFNALQHAQSRGIKVHFYGFDLLTLEARDLRGRELAARQAELGQAFKPTEYFHIPGPLKGSLSTILEKIQAFGFEGIIAKRINSLYLPGQKSGDWLKKKLKRTDEFVAGGFIPGANGIDELVVGKPRGRQLFYVASIDDGFVAASRRTVFAEIQSLTAPICPFCNLPEKKGPHRMDREKMEKVKWLSPKLAVEIAFNEWTPDKHLRHGEFIRLRPDKPVKEISPYPDLEA